MNVVVFVFACASSVLSVNVLLILLPSGSYYSASAEFRELIDGQGVPLSFLLLSSEKSTKQSK